MLRIHNSLTRREEDFVPLEAGKVRIYVCGMTVYDYCHLGHARVMIVFDMVVRWLRASGYHVTYVRNVTDIEDRIIKRAQENGESIAALTERFTRFMHEDEAALGVAPPDHEPRATRYVAQMLDLISKLEQKSFAYQASNGDVNYAVRKFAGYGKLSGKSLDDLRAGERVAVEQAKQDPLDFVLWKSAKESEPDEAKWDSKWGAGRPGWHIECSAMCGALLGESFDIHGGGADLQFPHHENEIAQSEAATGKPLAKYWMHNGFVRVNDEKMSKSLGNFFTVREILKRYDPEVVRFFILRGHYRSPINYSDKELDDAKNSLDRIYRALRGEQIGAAPIDWNQADAVRFKAAMDGDFNTPEAIAVLFKLADGVFATNDDKQARLLKSLGGTLGLLQRDAEDYFRGAPAGEAQLSAEDIDQRIAARLAARKNKNFAEADRIRKELLDAGVVLEDAAGATTWRRT
jgi:cysteinyl-tRNA synthetase